MISDKIILYGLFQLAHIQRIEPIAKTYSNILFEIFSGNFLLREKFRFRILGRVHL